MDRQLKYRLLDEVYNVTDRITVGTPKFKKVRCNVLKSIVGDLLDLKLDLKSFKLFNIDHFNALFGHWSKKGNSASTISNKKYILKWFLNHIGNETQIPSTTDLKIQREYKRPAPSVISDDIIHNVYHPINRTILDFQLYFGLSKTESIRINLDESVHKKELYISRKLAFNSNERFIPITSPEQKSAIDYRYQILGDKQTLLGFFKERELIEFYNMELLYNNISDKTDIRKYFMQKRLFIYQNKGFSKKESTELLMQETGFKNSNRMMDIALS